jgi:hypothetical protein
MTIVDPQIKDTSDFYIKKLYQSTNIGDHDSLLIPGSKIVQFEEFEEAITSSNGNALEQYSIKVIYDIQA